jgi:hypothetical protein
VPLVAAHGSCKPLGRLRLSCAALKIRCRSRSTSRYTRKILRSVHRKASNLPLGSSGSRSSSSPAHLPTSARFRARARGPLSGQLYGATGGGPVMLSRFPAAFRLPASASWASFPARELSPTYDRLTGTLQLDEPDPDGVSTFRTRETRTGPGALCTPGTAVFTRPRGILDRRLPHPSGMSLSSRHNHPAREVGVTRHQQGFPGSRPSGPSPDL